MERCAGPVVGIAVEARSYCTLWRANAAKLGVSTAGAPYGVVASARRVSMVTNTTYGTPDTGGGGGCEHAVANATTTPSQENAGQTLRTEMSELATLPGTGVAVKRHGDRSSLQTDARFRESFARRPPKTAQDAGAATITRRHPVCSYRPGCTAPEPRPPEGA